MSKSAIILPLKESYSNKDFGAVSIWVNYYISNSKKNKDFIFCKKIKKNQKYLSKKVIPIPVKSRFYTNHSYIKKISLEIKKKNISVVEIHNRPEYALYLIQEHPEIKINLIFHNDPNTIRYSDNKKYKLFLLEKCNKIIFVSNWIKSRYFHNLEIKHKNNIDVIYNFVKPIKRFPKKEKIIIFSGKLNKSKGFDIFGNAIIKILNENPKWKALVFGNEHREIFDFKHPRLKINNWISHKKLLKIYEKSAISVVNPTWDEPFGRTALESASRGCAVITSKSGGLSETFNNNLILKKNDSHELYNYISRLINNKVLLKTIQRINFNNLIHKPLKSISALDKLRDNKISLKKNKQNLKILHISNFGIKTNYRIFNLSIAKKISNGLIKNGHDVINFDYRNFNEGFLKKSSLDYKIISIIKNYQPNLVLLGHNNSLTRSTLILLKEKYNCKIALWYEDHVIKGDPSYRKNLDLIEKNCDLIDNYFITTSPDIIKSKIKKNKINYLPIPVDPNIENEEFYKVKKDKDLFFALSHGVNFGKLKKNTFDDRSKFIDKLISCSKNKINFKILGLYNQAPKWNYDFNNELMTCKTALNLSRGGPSKYASSNRIASLMGNGVVTFIDEKTKFQDFFKNGEIITYKNEADLVNKLLSIKDDKNKLIRIGKLGKKNYFKYFENTIIADFIISKTFKIKNKYRYIWCKK
jgi:glycosyltransferase involved in cell wall biosynthesis